MTGHNLVPNDRRARVICKLLGRNPALGLDALRELSTPSRFGSRTNGRRRFLRAAARADFDQSLALAISRGWLVEARIGLVLTVRGKEIAIRTRAGPHRSRWHDLDLAVAPSAVKQSRLDRD